MGKARKRNTIKWFKGKGFRFSLGQKLKVGAGGTLALVLLIAYWLMFSSNTAFGGRRYYIQVPPKTNIHDLADSLESAGILDNTFTFRLMAELMDVKKLREGLYLVQEGWGNYRILAHLQSDSLRPFVRVKIPAYRLRKNLVKSLCENFPNIERKDVWDLVRNQEFLDSLGYNKENIFCIFIPGNYYFFKDLNARQLVERMHEEYEYFWSKERRRKAKKLDLTPTEVSVLASIVYSETKLKEEMPRIAGVYLNRLNKKMRLQSDPTVIYAANKFGAQRVYFPDRDINSPYNTYRITGLPPGPIHVAPATVLDAVLNAEEHDYIYFCAKSDMSGCHLFSVTFEDHKKNAERYRNALDKAGIR